MATAQRKMKNMARLGSQRSYIYGFLATVYRKELTPELLDKLRDSQFLEALIGIGIQLEDEFFTLPREGLLENLAVEYTRLFMGPGTHIPPYESVHFAKGNEKRGPLWGESTVEVKRLVESLGMRLEGEGNSLPDHISTEMELMQKIAARESQAWREGDKEGALRCLHVEKRFIEDHLFKCISQFYEEVSAQAELQFYRGMAKLTMEFVGFEKENMSSYIASVKAVHV